MASSEMCSQEEILNCMHDRNCKVPWEMKHLKNVFTAAAIKKDSVTKGCRNYMSEAVCGMTSPSLIFCFASVDEFCLVAKTCPTLTFPAFFILDTSKL